MPVQSRGELPHLKPKGRSRKVPPLACVAQIPCMALPTGKHADQHALPPPPTPNEYSSSPTSISSSPSPPGNAANCVSQSLLRCNLIGQLQLTPVEYQNQATALIGICLFFSQFSTRGLGQSQHAESSRDAELTKKVSHFRMNFWPPSDGIFRVLKTCDDVLCFAAHSGHSFKLAYETIDRFQSAIDTLSSYASRFHPGSLGSVMIPESVSLTLV